MTHREIASILRNAADDLDLNGWIQGTSRAGDRQCMGAALVESYKRHKESVVLSKAINFIEADMKARELAILLNSLVDFHEVLKAINDAGYKSFPRLDMVDASSVVYDMSPLVKWNDNLYRTKDEVLSILRQAAQRENELADWAGEPRSLDADPVSSTETPVEELVHA